ncbi:MAG: OsmC family protein, partial [Pseudomonadota bacterium]|nr:OsmC family protein [Pseudomonadota bacterium]
SLEKNDDGFEITQSALSLDAEVEGITEDEFEKIAQEAKENCPVSQLLNANITLEYRLNIE